MTRIVVTAATILLLSALVGCQEPNRGTSTTLPRGPYTEPGANIPVEQAAAADEIDLVEQLAAHRQAYRRALEMLIRYYDVAGNNMKLTWAREELEGLDRVRQYRYIVEMPPDLKATDRIEAADAVFNEARDMERKAGTLPILKNEELLRAALGKYTELINKYPTSDKIDDAAFQMAGIHEYFKDYTLALSFYQRTYQWDPATPHPARFKAAWVLDDKLHRRAEALKLYQESVLKESLDANQKAFAERRIRELSTSDTSTQ
jgi:tetratricopeptide (TPR) repeat protein